MEMTFRPRSLTIMVLVLGPRSGFVFTRGGGIENNHYVRYTATRYIISMDTHQMVKRNKSRGGIITIAKATLEDEWKV